MLAKRGSLLIFAAITAFYFYGLGRLPLIGPDEPRYAQIAREMWQRGDWITPTLGGHLWFEKPALLYWMMIGSYKLFGVSEFSARLPSAFSGLMTIAAVFYLARRVERASSFGQTSLSVMMPLISASMLGLIVFARAASFDIVLTMTITWSLILFFVSQLEGYARRRRLFLAGFFAFIGLSLLAKGFIGIVIPIGVVGAYFLLLRRLPDRLTLFSFVWGIPLALLVAATWYGPVIARNGWPFVDQFILQHQLARYVSNDYRHPGAFYYYVLILPALSLPWIMFMIDAAVRARIWRFEENPAPENRMVRFAWAWVLFPLIFFSFSRAKLPAYILPVLPAVALLVGQRVATPDDERRRVFKITGITFVGAGIAAFIYAWRAGEPSLVCAAAIVAPLILSGVVLLLLKRRLFAVAVTALSTVALSVVVLHCAAQRRADRETSKRLIELASARGYAQTPIYGLMPDDRSPEFYAAGRVIYQLSGEPEMYIGPPQLVNETHRRKQTLLAFIPARDVAELSRAHAAVTDVIGDNGRHALVAIYPKLK